MAPAAKLSLAMAPSIVEVQIVPKTLRRKVGTLAFMETALLTIGIGPLKSPISTKHILVQVACRATCIVGLLAGLPLQ